MDQIGGAAATLGDAEQRRFRVVSIVAAAVALPLALAHLGVGVLASNMALMYSDMGGTLPPATVLLLNLAEPGFLGPILLVVDIAVFALLYRLAKRYWMGLLFVPALAYMAVSALIVPLFYLPMFEIITLVE